MLGFPIRTPSDQRSVGSSPRHIAASNVLHRPLMPRHPPCALKHLRTKPIENKNQNCTSTHKNATPTRRPAPHILRARCSQPLSTNQTPHPTTKTGEATTRLPPHTGAREQRACCLRTQQCVWPFFTPRFSHRDERLLYAPTSKPTTGAGDNPNRELRHCCRHGGTPQRRL